MTVHDPSKRRFLTATGGVLAAGLAGCLGGDGNGDGNGSDNSGEYDFDGWFDDVGNYDGVADHAGEDEITVSVGAGSEGYRFDPAAIAVDAGTTVVWEWTGAGGGHDVVDDDGAFESDLQTDEGATFERAFEETGTYEYYCTPHRGQGMKGAVVVE